MSMRFVVFVALRYFRSKRRTRRLASSVLSVAGISVGVMTLISVLAVMNGFQLSFIESIVGVSSYHLRLTTSKEGALEPRILESIRERQEVTAVVPFTEDQALIAGPSSSFYGCIVRGVAPDIIALDPTFANRVRIIDGRFGVYEPNTIVVGSELSKRIGIWADDRITLIALSGSADGLPTQQEFVVAGVFETGYQEFDLGWAFVSIESANKLFAADREASVIWGIKLQNRFRDRYVMRSIASQIADDSVEDDSVEDDSVEDDSVEDDGYELVSWRDYNRSFFGALRMEKIWMMVLIGLIFVVVGFNIAHSLMRTVYEKRQEIGALRALGAAAVSVQSVFIIEGFIIGFLGAVSGTALGLLVTNNINELFAAAETLVNWILYALQVLLAAMRSSVHFSRFSIFSSAHFYIAEVPIRVLLHEALLINLFALASSTLAAAFSAGRVAEFEPAAILRYE